MKSQQELEVFAQFKQYCQSNQLEPTDTNLKDWDAANGNIVAGFGGMNNASDFEAFGRKYYYKFWIEQCSLQLIASGSAIMATMRKVAVRQEVTDPNTNRTTTLTGMKDINLPLTPAEQDYVQKKAERSFESSIIRAKVLGSNEQKLIDILVRNVITAGIDLNTLLQYVTQSYNVHAPIPLQQDVESNQRNIV